MRKFTQLMLTLTMMIVGVGGANAQTPLYLGAGWSTSIEDVPALTGNVTYMYKNTYAAVNLISGTTISTADYKGFELELADDAPVSQLQFNFGSDKGEGNVEDYVGPITKSYKGTFPEGAITVSKISLQACNVADLGRVEIKSFYLIKNDDSKVATTYEMPASWAADLCVYNATMNFTEGGQWNFGKLLGASGIELPVRITVNATSLPANVQLNIGTTKTVGEGNRHEYRGWENPLTTYTVDIESQESGEKIDIIEIQNHTVVSPFKITNLNATVTQLKPISISSAGWATLYTDKALDFSGVEGLTAYTASVAGSTVTLTAVDDVPANTGLVLKGDEGTYKVPVIASSSTAKGDLTGSTTDGLTYDAGATKDYYFLALNGEGKAQFTKLTEGTIAAGKAYFSLAKGGSARELSVVFDDDEPTAIDDLTVDSEKQTEKTFFDLQGRKVVNPTKGIYIVDGKKVIINE